MKMICKECGCTDINEPSIEARYCPICGADLLQQQYEQDTKSDVD